MKKCFTLIFVVILLFVAGCQGKSGSAPSQGSTAGEENGESVMHANNTSILNDQQIKNLKVIKKAARKTIKS